MRVALVEQAAVLGVAPDRVQQVAVAAELELLRRGVPDLDRGRVAVAGEPVEEVEDAPRALSQRKVVSSAMVSGRYRWLHSNGSAGRSVKAPPPSGSSSAAHSGGASMRGAANQSTAPSAATSAAAWQSPSAP
ncbi:MAG TPA: hypothetical protein VFJ09_09525 [Nocardioidaceae bacterium]|nr:hypothetical protein [Nocardioidaceae bacterium]